MTLRRTPDDDPDDIDLDEVDAELEMVIKHLEAIDLSTTGARAALEAVARLGDDTLACIDGEDGLIGATIDGEDLFADLDAIETAGRRARRIIELRRIALEQGV